jgi:UDP-N-acetylmuramate: L-alanyl-gamma-D-glutamyl-meso-diaminopimelate ligase
MAFCLGIPFEHIREGVRTFRGVKRRQELLYDGVYVKIFEDFAHHPTAIAQVIGAMRERFPEAKIIAAYEPRSATSRRNVFQTELPAAFDGADLVCIKKPFNIEVIPEKDRIDAARVVDDIAKRGISAKLYEDADSIVSDIRTDFDATKRVVVVIMSNGGFDGIYGKMIAAAKEWEGRAGVGV